MPRLPKFTAMERQDIVQFAFFLVFFAYLMFIDMLGLTGMRRTLAGLGGIALIVLLMFVEEWVLFVMASKYTYVRALVRPSNKFLHLFYKRALSKCVDPIKSIYATRLILGEPVKIEPYGEVKEIVVIHKFPWDQRMTFRTGFAWYKGFRVFHPQAAYVEFYERPHAQFDVKFMEPIPVYNLHSASRDYYLLMGGLLTGNPEMSGQLSVLKEKIGEETLPEGYSSVDELLQELDKLRAENQALKDELAEVRRQAMDWHQEAVRLEEQLVHVRNELAGLIKSKPDFRNAVIEEMLVIREAQGGIERAIKHLRGRRFEWMPDWKTLGTMVIGLGVLAIVYLRWRDIAVGMQRFMSYASVWQNQLFLLGVVAIIGLTFFYAWKKGR